MSNDHGAGGASVPDGRTPVEESSRTPRITLTFTAALVGAAILLAAFWTGGASGVSQPNQAHGSQPVPDWFLPIADYFDRNPAVTPGFDFARLYDQTAAAPSPFELVFDGRHEPAADSPLGFWHVGPFTASGIFCSSGSGTTLGVTGDTPANATATRLFTCGGGGDSLTALVVPIDMEHGGAGAWRIVSGTGQYAKLRGRGTFSSVLVGGSPLDHGTIVFRSTWTGVADLDDAGPVLTVTSASSTKPRRPRGSYVVRIAFSARDTPGNAVGYLISVRGGGFTLASKQGATTSGSASAALRIRPATGVRTVRVEILASDPLGNESKFVRAVRLRR